MNKLISCQQHDYIEIACLYHYQVKLLLRNGETIIGIAEDVLTDSDKREYLALDQQRRIELNQIKLLRVLTKNAQFHSVEF